MNKKILCQVTFHFSDQTSRDCHFTLIDRENLKIDEEYDETRLKNTLLVSSRHSSKKEAKCRFVIAKANYVMFGEKEQSIESYWKKTRLISKFSKNLRCMSDHSISDLCERSYRIVIKCIVYKTQRKRSI